LKKATEDHIEIAHEIAKNWVDGHKKFSGVEFLAVRAVAEYLLNREGKTMFPEMVQKND
jgi:hypothetical protein